MNLRYAVAALGLLLLTSTQSLAAVVYLHWYSESGFTSGPYEGSPARLVIGLDGETGIYRLSMVDYSATGIAGTATLYVGNVMTATQAFSIDAFMSSDDGQNYLQLNRSGAFYAQFSAAPNVGFVETGWPYNFDPQPSNIDQYLKRGVFWPEAVAPVWSDSYIIYGGERANSTFLRVSDTSEVDIPAAVPIPATLPLFASALIGGGVIAWRKKRKRKAEPLTA